MTSRARRAALLAALALSACGPRREGRLVVGSKNFTEQVVVAEILAQHLEARAGLPVDRRFYLGGTYICHQAILAGRIDLYVEYTGTSLTAILKEAPGGAAGSSATGGAAGGGAADVLRRVQEAYAERFDLEVGGPLGFDNTFAILVRGEDARRLGLRTLSQAAAHAPSWRAGFGYEFMERPDGFPGLARAYALRFAAPPRIMDLGLMLRALADGQVDLVAGNSTDGLIEALDLAPLEDDRGYFPPYEAVPVVRHATLDRHPSVRAALASLAGSISAEEMRRMNHAVDGERRDVKEVAAEFLRRRGLIEGGGAAPDREAPRGFPP